MVVSSSTENNPAIRLSRYQGSPIVNEYEFQKELLFNNRLPKILEDGELNPDRKTYDEVYNSCWTGHFQGTNDENLYYCVATPIKRYVKGPGGVDDVVWETKKMFFKDFFEYLKYNEFKSGPEPRKDYFSSEKAYHKAYSRWVKKTKKNRMIVKGTRWNTYMEDHPTTQKYFEQCEKEHNKDIEYRQRRREEMMRMKTALGKNDDDGKWITVGYSRQKEKWGRNKKNNIDKDYPRLLVSPALVKVE